MSLLGEVALIVTSPGVGVSHSLVGQLGSSMGRLTDPLLTSSVQPVGSKSPTGTPKGATSILPSLHHGRIQETPIDARGIPERQASACCSAWSPSSPLRFPCLVWPNWRSAPAASSAGRARRGRSGCAAPRRQVVVSSRSRATRLPSLPFRRR